MTGGNGPFYFSGYSRSSLSHPGTVRLTRLAKQKGLLPHIGSSTQSLAEGGASAIRVWTPAVHELVILHDKGSRRILSP